MRDDRPEPLAVRTLDLVADEPATVRLSDVPPDDQAGVYYRAALVEPDLLAKNNTLTTPVVRPRPTLLWVAGERGVDPVAPAGWRVRRIAPARTPTRVDELLGYAAIAVVDAGGRALSESQRVAAWRYVRLGGGLLLVGSGPYGSAEDPNDPLNRVAPLVVNGRGQRKLDVAILLDGSASMAEPAGADRAVRKFDIVREAVGIMARRQLVRGDHLQVITFTGMPTERFDGPVSDENLEAVAAVLAEVRPVGGTRVAPALRMALEGPVDPARDRLVVVLSDLQTEAFDPSRWADRLNQASAGLAVVAVGEPDDDAPLARLADRTGGRFELRGDLTGLADLFVRLLRQFRGDPLIRRVQSVRVHPGLFARAIDNPPRIDTYLAAAIHEDAEVLVTTRRDEPLLAARRAGAGRTVGLVAPLQEPYNLRWRTDPAIADLLAAAVGWVGMPSGDPAFAGEFARAANGGTLTITASNDDAPINHLRLEAGWSADDGAIRTAPLLQVAPGRYTTDIPVPIDQPVVLTVRRTDDGRVVFSRPFAGTYPAEFARTGVDPDDLERLASRTAGRVVTAEQLGRRLQQLDSRRRLELWPWLLVASIAAMLIDWIVGARLRR